MLSLRIANYSFHAVGAFHLLVSPVSAAVKWVEDCQGYCQRGALRCSMSPVKRNPDGWGWMLLALLLLLFSGCASSSMAASKKPMPGAPNTLPPQWLRTELYLAAVDASEWETFLAERITRRFPAGFTVFDAYGQWRAPQGDIRRLSTKVVVILHPPTHEAEQAIEAIRKEYCAAFNQISVLRSTTPALVSF